MLPWRVLAQNWNENFRCDLSHHGGGVNRGVFTLNQGGDLIEVGATYGSTSEGPRSLTPIRKVIGAG